MITFEPSVSVVQFSALTAGCLLHIAGQLGIWARNTRSTPDFIFVAYIKERSRFELQEPVAQSGALSYGSDLVITPNVVAAFDADHPREQTANALFLDGDRPLVMLHLSNNDFRMLDLSSGVFDMSRNTSTMSGFREWAVCVRAGEELLPMIDVGPRAALISGSGRA